MFSLETLEHARRQVVHDDEEAHFRYILATLGQKLQIQTLAVKRPPNEDTDARDDATTVTDSAASEMHLILSKTKSTIYSHVNTADLDLVLLELRKQRQIENKRYTEASKVRWGFRDRVLEDHKKVMLEEAEIRNDIETLELLRLRALAERLAASDLTHLALLQLEEESRRRSLETTQMLAMLQLTSVLHHGVDSLELGKVGDLASPDRSRRAVESLSPERLSPRRAHRFCVIEDD